MVEFNVIDFIGCLSLESLIDQVVFTIGYPQLLSVEDRPETGVGNETTVALVLVLEEWLDQQSAVSDVSSNSLHANVEFGLFSFRQLSLSIQDGWRIVSGQGFLWCLLQILLCEDFLNLFIEVEVSNLQWVPRASVVVLKFLIFFSRQLEFLCIQCGSELGGLNGTLSKWIMILEELTDSNSVSHDVVLDLLHEWINVSSTSEINVEIDVG